jgi:hypothetical protein
MNEYFAEIYLNLCSTNVMSLASQDKKCVYNMFGIFLKVLVLYQAVRRGTASPYVSGNDGEVS